MRDGARHRLADDAAHVLERQAVAVASHEMELDGQAGTLLNLTAGIEEGRVELHRAGRDDDLDRLAPRRHARGDVRQHL
jgi:hypothetical protein